MGKSAAFWPVCMLHKALVGGVASGESFAPEATVNTTSEQAVQGFEKSAERQTGGPER